MPKRPSGVPDQASWNGSDERWFLGVGKTSSPLGNMREERAWRHDGTPYYVGHHDRFGSRDGRFEFFHPDGTLANAQEWKSFRVASRGPIQLSDMWQRSTTCPAKPGTCECWQFGGPKKVWRYEKNEQTGAAKYYLRDGTPCDKNGQPRGAKRAATKAPKRPPTRNKLVRAWRGLEALLHERGLGFALHYAPRTLKWDKPPKWAASADELLPSYYLAFVKEVGYPMLGLTLYCDVAWSFLPPAPLRFQSTECFGKGGEEPTERVLAAFFAAYRDLADVTGYAFVAGAAGPEVWRARDALAQKRIGPFTPWMNGEIARLTKWAKGLSPREIAALEEASEDAEDPHRLIDYAH